MPKKFLIVTQVFPPDPAAVGQYFEEAARELRSGGVEVEILTANSGYENPDERFASLEEREGVIVRRLPLSSFGKASMPVRIFGQLSFLIQSILRILFQRGVTDLLVSTSPPMCAIVAVVVGFLRPSLKVHYWVMDVNPDQAVALGVFAKSHPLVLAMDWLNRRVLQRADTVVVLDRFMQDRLEAKTQRTRRPIEVIPPWPMAEHVEPVLHAENPFRKKQCWQDKFVIMYSGNHSIVHPLDTILEAAEKLRGDKRFVFAFIGGGNGKAVVDARISKWAEAYSVSGENEAALPSVVSLPYQPLDTIKYSLSAADIHLVSLGDNMSGIVHPCKLYGAMAIGRPILALGPKDSYLNDLLGNGNFGWSVAHGDVNGVVEALKEAVALSDASRSQMGCEAQALVSKRYSRQLLLGRFLSTITQE